MSKNNNVISRNFGRIFVKVVALILAVMMMLVAGATVAFCLIAG